MSSSLPKAGSQKICPVAYLRRSISEDMSSSLPKAVDLRRYVRSLPKAVEKICPVAYLRRSISEDMSSSLPKAVDLGEDMSSSLPKAVDLREDMSM